LDVHKNQERVNEIKGRIARLTRREKEVMEYVLESKQNKVIASLLGISIKTVELHRANLMAKMRATSSTELVRIALIADYISDDE
jgi:two-component system, LuxR family, response regulator FixJ